MSGEFFLDREPRLRNPRLIVGLPDAGYVGLRVLDYLGSKLRTEEFGHIEPRGFSVVPWVSVKDGVIEDHELLRNRFRFWKNSGGGNDLVLFKSEQPTARPYDYVDVVLEVAQQVGVKRMYILGSFGAVGVSHEEPHSALGVVNQPHLRKALLRAGVDPYPEYKGMGTIHSSFLWFAKARKLEAIGLWSPIPHYIARLPLPWSNCPGASLCLLQKISAMEGLRVETTEMEALARRTEEEMRTVYDQLHEEAKNEMAYTPGDMPAVFAEQDTAGMSDEELRGTIKDIEDFFRKEK